jgi:hypothetical protein
MRKIITGHGAGHRPASGDNPRCLRTAEGGAKAAPSPPNSLSGPVGTVYTVTGQSGDTMTVTLTKVIDPAQGADQFTTPGNGNPFAGAIFTITGISGTLSDDANNDATLVGSNGQTHTADFGSIAGYTNFNSGEDHVGAGRTPWAPSPSSCRPR